MLTGRMTPRRDGSSYSDPSPPSSQSSWEDGHSPTSSNCDQDEEGEPIRGDPMEDFYTSKARIDAKPTTLTLEENSIDFYFGTLLKDGEMSKEGREKLRDKYYLH